MGASNFESYWSQMTKTYLSCLLHLVGILKVIGLKMGKNEFKLSTMVGGNFLSYWSQMAKIVFKLSTMVENKNQEIFVREMQCTNIAPTALRS